jgi:hypothetical protein
MRSTGIYIQWNLVVMSQYGVIHIHKAVHLQETMTAPITWMNTGGQCALLLDELIHLGQHLANLHAGLHGMPCLIIKRFGRLHGQRCAHLLLESCLVHGSVVQGSAPPSSPPENVQCAAERPTQAPHPGAGRSCSAEGRSLPPREGPCGRGRGRGAARVQRLQLLCDLPVVHIVAHLHGSHRLPRCICAQSAPLF